MHNKIRGLIFLLVALSVLPLISADVENAECANVVLSDLTPSSIAIDDEFTIGIQIENCGVIPPSNLTFEIYSVPIDIEIKEPLKYYIQDLSYANSQRFISFHLKTSKKPQIGTHIIKAKIEYGPESLRNRKDLDISFTVIGDKAELSIASVKSRPVIAYLDDIVELTLRIENVGDGKATSLKINADHPFQGVRDSFIGSLDPDEEGPALFTFIADRTGSFQIPIKISYRDDFGTHEFIEKVDLSVIQKKEDFRKKIPFIVVSIFALILLIAIFFLKHSKDKIIRNLLKGNSPSPKK